MTAVNCKRVTVAKTAKIRFSRDYAWDPDSGSGFSDADAPLVSRADCLAAPIASGDYAGYFLCNDAAIRLDPGDRHCGPEPRQHLQLDRQRQCLRELQQVRDRRHQPGSGGREQPRHLRQLDSAGERGWWQELQVRRAQQADAQQQRLRRSNRQRQCHQAVRAGGLPLHPGLLEDPRELRAEAAVREEA
jgi:hypothetical protein